VTDTKIQADRKSSDSGRFSGSVSEIQCSIHKRVSFAFLFILVDTPSSPLVPPPQGPRPLSELRGVCPPDEVAKVTTVIIFTYFKKTMHHEVKQPSFACSGYTLWGRMKEESGDGVGMAAL